MTAGVQDVLADPVSVIVAMITGIEPALELAVIEEAVTSVAGGRAKRRKLAQALARRPAILTDGRSPAPRAAGDLLVALRRAMESKWVTTLGGPHILIPQSACRLWNGAPPNYPDEEGDYGRACAVDGYIGLIDVGQAQALVFADHPGRTTFLPGHGILLREIAGGDDDEVLDATLKLLPTIKWGSQLSWEITESLILFDSVYDYPHVLTEGEEQIRVDLAPGRYTVEAAYLHIPDIAYLILVRLTPATQPAS